jgi:hypothetical protein
VTTPVLSETAAVDAALAAEQAAIYGYGVAGAFLTDTDRSHALNDLEVHQVLRDRLTAILTASGQTPPAARPAYQLPFAVTNATTARQLAAALEEGCAGAAWDLVAASTTASVSRRDAISMLTEAAQRAARWGARQALPGQPAPTA